MYLIVGIFISLKIDTVYAQIITLYPIISPVRNWCNKFPG